MYRKDPSYKGYFMVYFRSLVKELRTLRNPSVCIYHRSL